MLTELVLNCSRKKQIIIEHVSVADKFPLFIAIESNSMLSIVYPVVSQRPD